MIDSVRTFIGCREYPKFGMVSGYAIYKPALLAEANRLVRVGVLDDREDIYYLSFHELRMSSKRSASTRSSSVGAKAEFKSYLSLAPPECSPRMAKGSPANIDGTTCRTERSPASPSPPGRHNAHQRRVPDPGAWIRRVHGDSLDPRDALGRVQAGSAKSGPSAGVGSSVLPIG